MQLYRDDGIVLRTQKLGEADRIITVLGRSSGRVRAVAKGVPRTKSRFGARLDPRLVLDAFLLRSLAVAGYAPALQECARCGASGNGSGGEAQAAGGRRLPAFAIPAGGMVCASCRPPGAASPAAPTVALLLALLQGDWESADRSERRHRGEGSGLVAPHLQWPLEPWIR